MVPNEKTVPHPSVLVVEDEAMLLMIVAETLRDAGYEVWEAGDGEAALNILKQHDDIGLMITDVKMPGMNGYEVANSGLALRPDLKVLLMTGFAQEPIPKKISDAGIPVLYKPFDFDKLPSLAGEILGA